MSDSNNVPAPAPLFKSKDLSATAQAAVAQRGTPSTLNLDEIFSDVVFTPDGDTQFLSEQQQNHQDPNGGLMNSGEGANVSTMASRPTEDGKYAPVSMGGGLYTTSLAEAGKQSSAMGKEGDAKPTAPVPFKTAPQARHHLQYAAPKKRKEPSSSSSSRGDRKMSEQQKVERRYVVEFSSSVKNCKLTIASSFTLCLSWLEWNGQI